MELSAKLRTMVDDAFIEKLKKHNPFKDWDNLKRPISFSKVGNIGYHHNVRTYFNRIPFHLMDFGDSIFIPMVSKYWKLYRRRHWVQMDRHEKYCIKAKWFNKDPVCGFSGMRVWCFNRKLKIKRPSHSFRIKNI